VARIGYHCSHEQYPPSTLLGLVERAERAGFQSAMCSDHFHPWSEAQGQSGFAWSWLGAALARTSLAFGVVTVPGGWRYHPTLIAQAAATLDEMFPGRFWIAPGSGEALNEHIVGRRWPGKGERNARLLEGVEIIRALWRGETVDHRGLIRVEDARLYTLPRRTPLIVGAALTPATARWMGGWADGLITVVRPLEEMRRMIDAFHEGGGEGKPLFLQAQLAFGTSPERTLREAWEQWRTAIFPSGVLAALRMPEEFDAAAEYVREDDMHQKVRVSTEWEQHLEWLREYVALGFEEINLHNIPRSGQERFLEVFGERVLPELVDE
jgi:coenzyme F420-dependent glucose-6-phosphate dehydrogenase